MQQYSLLHSMGVIALPVIVNRLAVKGTIAYFVIHSSSYVGHSDHVSDFRLATLCSAVHIYMNAYIYAVVVVA